MLIAHRISNAGVQGVHQDYPQGSVSTSQRYSLQLKLQLGISLTVTR